MLAKHATDDPVYLTAAVANDKQAGQLKIIATTNYLLEGVTEGVDPTTPLYRLNLQGAEGWFEEKFLGLAKDPKFFK